ncbi:MAG: FUSC family protein [Burkholderiales bacterium]|nr:FUSC family protein [Burkholderiales bacterium]
MLKKISAKYISHDKEILSLGIQAGVLSAIFSLLHVFLHNITSIALFAVVGVFVCSLIQTIAMKYGVYSRIVANILLAVSAGVFAILGSQIGNNLLVSSLIIILIVPFVGFASLSDAITAALVLFTVDLFVVSAGLKFSIDASIIYGLAFTFGGVMLAVSSYIFDVIIFNKNKTLTTSVYKFKFSNLFVKFKLTITFAILLTMAVLLANFIAIHFRLPQGFWVPMTTLLILKNDGAFTRQRLIHRLFGTFYGSIVAAIVIYLIANNYILAILILPLMFFIVSSLSLHYGAYTFFLTIMISILVDLLEPGGYAIPLHRITDTVLGILCVVIALFFFQPIINYSLSNALKRKKVFD